MVLRVNLGPGKCWFPLNGRVWVPEAVGEGEKSSLG